MNQQMDIDGPLSDKGKDDLDFEEWLYSIGAWPSAVEDKAHVDQLREEFAGLDPNEVAADELHDYLVDQREPEEERPV